MNKDFFADLFNTQDAFTIFSLESLIYFFGALIVFFVGRVVHDFCTPYKLNAQMTEHDNKAVALSFGAYLFGLFIIFSGVISSPSSEKVLDTEEYIKALLLDVGNVALWSMIGIVILQVSRIVNDKILLRKFCNTKELVDDRNIGAGAVEAGTFIGTALIVKATVSGESSETFLQSLVATLIYFVVAQALFIVFGFIYNAITKYCIHDEIEKDNVAAGVSLGMSLIAIAILISGYIVRFDSLVGLIVWFFIATALLLFSRVIVDRFLLPGSPLDEEVERDQNWGASFVEGLVAIGIAFLCISSL